MISLLASLVLAAPPAVPAPFEADGDTLRQAFEGIEADVGVAVLLDELVHRVEEDGTSVFEKRLIWQLRDREARDNWGMTTAPWVAWRADRPQIDIRVHTPDGRVLSLDQGLVAENREQADGPITLTAPLPELVEGSIVEERLVFRDSRPYLGGGTAHRIELDPRYDATAWFVRRIEVPAERPFVWAVEDTIEATEAVVDGTRRVEVVLQMPELVEGPTYVGEDVWADARLLASSVGGWARVREAGEAIFEGRQVEDGLEDVLKTLRALPADERLAAAHAMAQGPRSSGLDFGMTPHEVVPPAAVLERGVADPEDRVNLLLTLLNAVGIEAHPALVNRGFDKDIDPAYPTTHHFNHVVVHLPTGEWLDPAAPLVPIGMRPAGIAGRQALVLDGMADHVVTIPEYGPGEAVYEHERVFDLTGATPRVEDRVLTATGWLGPAYRHDFVGMESEATVRAQLEGWFEDLGATYVSHEVVPPTDLSRPFAATVVGELLPHRSRGLALGGELLASAGDIWADAPRILTTPAGDDDVLEGRTLPLAFLPYRTTSTTRVKLGSERLVKELPEDVRIEEGPLAFRRTHHRTGQEIVIEETFVIEASRAEAEQARRFRDALEPVAARVSLDIQPKALALLEDGAIDEAFAHVRQLEGPQRPLVEGTLLGRLGLGDQALEVLEAGLQRYPDDLLLMASVGRELTLDAVGHRKGRPRDLERGTALLKRARKEGVGQPWVLHALASAELRHAHRNPAEAAPHLEAFLEIASSVDRIETIEALVALGRCGAARAEFDLWDQPGLARELVVEACAGSPRRLEAWVDRLGLSDADEDRLLLDAERLTAYTDPHPVRQNLPLPEPAALAPEDHALLVDSAEALIGLARHERWPDTVHKQLRRHDPAGGKAATMARTWADHTPESFVARMMRWGTVTVEGDAKGRRLSFSESGLTRAYFVPDGDGWTLRAFGRDPAALTAVAKKLAKKDLEAANTWFRWAVEATRNRQLRLGFKAPTSKAEVRNLLLFLDIAQDRASVEQLDRALDLAEAEKSGPRRKALQRLVLFAAWDRPVRFADGVAAVQERAMEALDLEEDVRQYRRRVLALNREDWKMARANLPDDASPAQEVAVLMREKRFDDAVAILRTGEADVEWNNLLWRMGIAGRSAEALEHAREVLDVSNDAEYHTLATLAALEGDYITARDALREEVERAGGLDYVRSHWRVIDGLMLHRLGYADAAREAFDAVETEGGSGTELFIPEGYGR